METNIRYAEGSSIVAASNEDFTVKFCTSWPVIPACLESWPSSLFLPTVDAGWSGNGSVKLTDVVAVDRDEAGRSNGDRTGAILHIDRKSWSLLPLHLSGWQKVAGPRIVGCCSSDDEDAHRVESCNCTVISWHCQVSHPALVPALVALVQNKTGGSLTFSSDISSTGGNDRVGI